MSRTTHARQAFSLVEMCVVMTIIAIAAAITVPRYASSLDNYRVSFAARKVAADIELAQANARAQSAGRSVVFTTSSNSYQIQGLAGQDGHGATYTVLLTSAPYNATLYSASFAGTSQISFDGYGAPSGAGSVVVKSGQASKTINVDGQTGACSIP